MAKQDSGNAFDEILTSFSADEDRQAFTSLTERNPWLKDYGLRQSDYSRKMNENREKLEQFNQWTAWRTEHWDDESGTTREHQQVLSDLAKEREAKTQLEQQIALGEAGGDVDFSTITTDLDKYLTDKGVITKQDLDAKEKEFRTQQGAMTTASLVVPYLNIKHNKEFGEPFNPSSFVEEAVKKGRYDLEDFYERDFVLAKREAKRDADTKAEMDRIKTEADAKVAAAQKEADERVARATGLGTGGGPTDTEGPEMGAFQRSYLKLHEKPQEGSEAPNVEIGEGGIAAWQAREYRNKMAGRA